MKTITQIKLTVPAVVGILLTTVVSAYACYTLETTECAGWGLNGDCESNCVRVREEPQYGLRAKWIEECGTTSYTAGTVTKYSVTEQGVMVLPGTPACWCDNPYVVINRSPAGACQFDSLSGGDCVCPYE